jgi:methionyl-tRNA formyltransferase
MNARRDFVLALNRDIGRRIYRWLVERGDPPAGLLLPREPDDAAHDAAADARGREIPVFLWPEVADRPSSVVSTTGADLFISIHFPELLPDAWLSAFRSGCVNLHPAFLPWGRGWHTPTWAILEGTPFGVTLHHIGRELDAGDVIAQRRVHVRPDHTAHTLYRDALAAELTLFQEAWSSLRDGSAARAPQPSAAGSFHRRRDLDRDVRRIDLDAPVTGRALLTQLRALTTNRWNEAAWFEEDGRRYVIRVELAPEEA